MARFAFARQFFYSQLFVTPALPTKSFAHQVVIVTGSNTGLGKESALQIVQLGAAKVILAVRNVEKGERARQYIETKTGRLGVVEVWELDLSSYSSVLAFARRAQGLDRLDVLLENASILTHMFVKMEQDESTITVNVVSTFLLALLMIPKLRQSAAKFKTRPHLTIVASDGHFFAAFKEQNASNIFEALNNEATSAMRDRYMTSKLMQILILRQLSQRLSPTEPIILNCLNPGLCHSEIFRGQGIRERLLIPTAKFFLARTTAVGARTLTVAASADESTHGKYMADGVVSRESAFVTSGRGDELGKRVFNELVIKLERIRPGISDAMETK